MLLLLLVLELGLSLSLLLLLLLLLLLVLVSKQRWNESRCSTLSLFEREKRFRVKGDFFVSNYPFHYDLELKRALGPGPFSSFCPKMSTSNFAS